MPVGGLRRSGEPGQPGARVGGLSSPWRELAVAKPWESWSYTGGVQSKRSPALSSARGPAAPPPEKPPDRRLLCFAAGSSKAPSHSKCLSRIPSFRPTSNTSSTQGLLSRRLSHPYLSAFQTHLSSRSSCLYRHRHNLPKSPQFHFNTSCILQISYNSCIDMPIH